MGWEKARPTFGKLWHGNMVPWTEERSDVLFAGVMGKLETRRKRRRVVRLAIACAGLAVTMMVGLGLLGLRVNGPFAHLWSVVPAG
jgi:hypothetical protein